MVERLRGFYSALLRPAARLLARLGVSPDAVTVTGTVLAVLAALVCVPAGWLWQGALLLGVLVLSDGLDGELARLTGTSSAFGAFLDSCLDRIVDGVVFGTIVVWLALHEHTAGWALVALWALVMGQVTSYVKARAEAHGFTCQGGLAARGDRLLVGLLAMLLAGLGVPYALHAGVCLLALGGTATVLQRFGQVWRQAKARGHA